MKYSWNPGTGTLAKREFFKGILETGILATRNFSTAFWETGSHRDMLSTECTNKYRNRTCHVLRCLKKMDSHVRNSIKIIPRIGTHSKQAL